MRIHGLNTFVFRTSWNITCSDNDVFAHAIESPRRQRRGPVTTRTFLIGVIAVAPTGKASFVYGCMKTRLMGQYNGK